MARPADNYASRPERLRAVGWLVGSAALFVGLLLGLSYLVSVASADINFAYPQREHFAALVMTLLGTSLLLTIPIAGRILGGARFAWPTWTTVLPFLLAPVLAYLIFEDVRSGTYFETDHALPEIFIPLSLALIGSARVGYGAAIDRSGLQAWSWVMVAAALSVTALVAATIEKILSQTGGDSQLDSPATFAGLAVAGAYAVVTIFHASQRISASRRTCG